MPWWTRPLVVTTVKGATITLASTLLSCALAIQVEKSANRLFFSVCPEKYAALETAYGIDPAELEAVRMAATRQGTTMQSSEASSSMFAEASNLFADDATSMSMTG
jgi:hypothetical protein